MKEEKKELWAIAYTPGREYMGCIVGVITTAGKIEDPEKKDVIRMRLNGHLALEMNPLYDYATPLGNSPTGGMEKRVFTTPIGMTTEPFSSYIFDPCKIDFIDDMSRFDRDEHRKYIEEAAILAQEARKTASPLDLSARTKGATPGGQRGRFPRD